MISLVINEYEYVIDEQSIDDTSKKLWATQQYYLMEISVWHWTSYVKWYSAIEMRENWSGTETYGTPWTQLYIGKGYLTKEKKINSLEHRLFSAKEN